jgi:hypothetical protein
MAMGKIRGLLMPSKIPNPSINTDALKRAGYLKRRPPMRTIIWLIALFANFGVIVAFAPSTLGGDIVGLCVFGLLFAIGALLVAARLGHLPPWGHKVMLLLCFAVPLLAFVGSLDYGIISGQEFISLIVAVLLGLGSWRAFLLFAPKPIPAVKRDATKAARPLP